MPKFQYSLSRSVLAVSLALSLAACATTASKTPPPTLELPATQGAAVPADVLARWWLQFDDAQLNALVEQAFANNTDLKAAAARVEQSAALLTNSRSYLFPTVDAYFGGSRSRATEVGAMPRQSGVPLITNTFEAGLNVSYEVDLWGRIRNANDAAAARYLATQDAQNGVRSALASQVAQAWFNLLALNQKLDITRRTLTTREEALRVQQRLFDVGSGGPLSLRQAEAERDYVASLIPNLVSAVGNTERSLSVLTGASPRAMLEQAIKPTSAVLVAPPQVPAGLSSDLLTRRPDIRYAEATLAAANASVAQARADFFPRITLTGSIGKESAELSDLFSGPAGVWRLAGAIAQPIFGAGRIASQVDAADAQRKEAEATYVGVVQAAFKELYDSLGGLEAASNTLLAQEKQIVALRETNRIAARRFEAGLSSYLEVLDAERNLLNAETGSVDSRLGRLTSTVNVYRSLGGGWQAVQQVSQAAAN